MVSVTTAPPRRAPSCRPSMVIVGMSAFFNAWRSTTARGARPFARAVTMYSWCSTPSTPERTSRASTADEMSPSAVAGMTSRSSPPCPVAGNHPSVNENKRISSRLE